MSLVARHACRAAVLCLLACWPGPAAHAADELPTAGWHTRTIAVLPVGYLGRSPEALFDSGGVDLAVRLGRLHRIAEETLAALPHVEVVRAPEVQRRIGRSRTFRSSRKAAESLFAVGVSSYEELRGQEAAKEQLRQAWSLYEGVDGALAVPQDVADVAFYQGLVATEQGDATAARERFRAALMLDPRRTFERGYYPPAVEKALEAAQRELVAAPGKLDLRFPAARRAEIGTALKVDGLLMMVVDGPPTSPTLHLAIYERASKTVTMTGQVTATDPAQVEDRIDRLLSAWHACTVEARDSRLVRKRKRKKWFLDISYTHGLWLTHERTRDILQSVGGELTLSYEPTSAFQVYAQAGQVATLRDEREDLIDQFVSLRVAVGAGLVVGGRDLRFFARTALALGLALNDIDMTTDVDCKFFGEQHDRCGSVFRADAPAVWFGLDFTLGARIRLIDDWYVNVAAGAASYLFDPDVVSNLNFPMHFSAGFGSAF